MKTYVFIILSLFLLSQTTFASGAKRPEVPTENAGGTLTEAETENNIPTPPTEPPTVEETTDTIEKYSYLDPDKVVPSDLLEKTVAFYEANQNLIKNKRHIIVIDFKQHNSKKRFYLIDMETGIVEQYLTAHGKNSDPDFDGYATKFSNTPNSLMSSLGFYVTAETYYGENDYSLRLDGLSSTNSNARSRAIVIHGASYVRNAPLIGRSYGCPALDASYATDVIDRIKGGTLIFADG